MPEINRFKDLVLKNRSFRRFSCSKEPGVDVLRELADLATKTPSAGNLQPLRLKLVHKKEDRDRLFKSLFWAAYLKDWDGPEPDEMPGGYIIIAKESSLKGQHYLFDTGITAQTILLGAVEKGLGGCMLASFKADEIKKDFLGDDYEPVLVIALGEPVEKVVLEPVGENGSIKYYRDESKIHHVPKRQLDDILI